MNQTLQSVIVIVGLLLALPFFMLLLRDRINRARYRRRNPPEKIAADRKAFAARLLHPDWAFYERHLQRPAPAALRELYADQALIKTDGLDHSKEDRINGFGALDEQGLIDSRPWLGFDAVAIATTDFGDPIYLRPGPSEPDIVYITYHDGGDTEVFAESVVELLEGLRRAKHDG